MAIKNHKNTRSEERKLKPMIWMFLYRIPFNEGIVVIIELFYLMIFYSISLSMDASHKRRVEFSLSLSLSLSPFLRMTKVPSSRISEKLNYKIKVLTYKGVFRFPCGLKWLEPKLGLGHLIQPTWVLIN